MKVRRASKTEISGSNPARVIAPVFFLSALTGVYCVVSATSMILRSRGEAVELHPQINTISFVKVL